MNKKIAIPINENEILEGHFGQTKAFAFYNIESNKIIAKEVLTPPAHAPGVLPKWIHQNGATHLLASTMGERAKNILDYFNVEVHLGTPQMAADKIIKLFLAGKLEFDPKLCDHHHHHEHEHGHDHQHNHHNHK